jgi:hypothetical protein
MEGSHCSSECEGSRDTGDCEMICLFAFVKLALSIRPPGQINSWNIAVNFPISQTLGMLFLLLVALVWILIHWVC